MRELLARFPDYEVDASALEREASEFQVGWVTMPIATGASVAPVPAVLVGGHRDVYARGALGTSSRQGTGE